MNKKGNILCLILILFFGFSLIFLSYFFINNRYSHIVQANAQIIYTDIERKEIAYQVYLGKISCQNAYKEGDEVIIIDGDNRSVYEFYVEEEILKVKKKNE